MRARPACSPCSSPATIPVSVCSQRIGSRPPRSRPPTQPPVRSTTAYEALLELPYDTAAAIVCTAAGAWIVHGDPGQFDTELVERIAGHRARDVHARPRGRRRPRRRPRRDRVPASAAARRGRVRAGARRPAAAAEVDVLPAEARLRAPLPPDLMPDVPVDARLARAVPCRHGGHRRRAGAAAHP